MKLTHDDLVARWPELFGRDGCYPAVGDGWLRLLDGLAAKLTLLSRTWPGLTVHVSTIKEKYGGLRFYADFGCGDGVPSEALGLADDAVSQTEHLSHQVCEACGDYGSARAGGWIKTLCGKCAYDTGRPIRAWEAAALVVTDAKLEPEGER